MIDARVSITEYSNKVLGVIKAKYSLHDKSEALNKFIELYGESEVEQEVDEKYVKKILKLEENHFKKYSYRKMKRKELENLFGSE